MSKRIYIMTTAPHPARKLAIQAIAESPDGYVVTIEPPKRSPEQNKLLWALLGEVSRLVEWYGEYLTAEEWKDVFTAAYRRQKVVPGIDGGFVNCGMSTRVMSKAELNDVIEIIYAFASQRGIELTRIEKEK